MSKLDDIFNEAIDRRLDAMVTPDTLHRQIKPLIDALDMRDFHHTQIRAAVEQWEQLVYAGERPSVALERALLAVGEPGKVRGEVWDES